MTIDDCLIRPIVINEDKTKHRCYYCLWSEVGCIFYDPQPRDTQLDLFKDYKPAARPNDKVIDHNTLL